MSQLSKGIFCAMAVASACGAFQLASERDGSRPGSPGQLSLAQFGPLSFSSGPPPQSSPAAAVNRVEKTDRAAAVPAVRSRTISLRLNGLSDTSVLVRMPVAREALDRAVRPPLNPPLDKSGVGKPMVACEPSVSVLTEVAKHLQPGRCVT